MKALRANIKFSQKVVQKFSNFSGAAKMLPIITARRKVEFVLFLFQVFLITSSTNG